MDSSGRQPREAFYGGAAGGGKSEALLMAAAQYVEVPGYSALILRKTLPDLNQAGALIPRSHEYWAGSDAIWHENKKQWKFPSGATIRFGYLERRTDLDNYMGCFHPDTEMLTANGWIKVSDAIIGQQAASLDPETRRISFERIDDVFAYYYNGDLLVSNGPKSYVTMAVTPNHKLPFSFGSLSSIDLVEAKDFPSTGRIPQTGIWSGVLPISKVFYINGQDDRVIQFSAGDWPLILGALCANGFIDHSRERVSIVCDDKRSRKMIADLVRRAGGYPVVEGKIVWFTCCGLADWMAEHVIKKSERWTRHIPFECYGWHMNAARKMIEGMTTTTKRPPAMMHPTVLTAHTTLVDGIFRLAMNAGWTAYSTYENGVYSVSIPKERRDAGVTLEPRPYEGMVYCVNVPPHHIILTRLYGRVSWSGQSEYQCICFDEATQFALDLYRFLFSRLRKRKGMEVPLRVRAASNPGNIGHEWVKQRFIEEANQDPNNPRIFVPAKLYDNPSIDAEEYILSLNELDPITRAQLLEGDWSVGSSAGNFRREWFEGKILEDEPTDFERVVRYWDTAATAPQPGQESRADWSVGTKMGRRSNGQYVILDVVRFQGNPATLERNIKLTADMDGPYVDIFMEQEPGASGKVMIEHYRDRVLNEYYFEGIRSTGPKEARAARFSSQCEAGNIYLVRGNWMNRWFDELEAFPFGNNDDQVDSGAGAYNQLALGGDVRYARQEVANHFDWQWH
jgi:predicted phage terminase large subunit-like protein